MEGIRKQITRFLCQTEQAGTTDIVSHTACSVSQKAASVLSGSLLLSQAQGQTVAEKQTVLVVTVCHHWESGPGSSGCLLVVKLWTSHVWYLLVKVIQAPASPESLEMSLSNFRNINSPGQRLPLPVRVLFCFLSLSPKISLFTSFMLSGSL